MVTEGVENGSLRADTGTHSPSQMAWSEGRQLLGAVLHSLDEQSEFSK